MLALAKQQMARLKFDAIDVLIIDEIGKDISGVGFDTNVSGRIEVISQQAAFRAIAPDIKKIVLLSLAGIAVLALAGNTVLSALRGPLQSPVSRRRPST